MKPTDLPLTSLRVKLCGGTGPPEHELTATFGTGADEWHVTIALDPNMTANQISCELEHFAHLINTGPPTRDPCVRCGKVTKRLNRMVDCKSRFWHYDCATIWLGTREQA